MCQSQVLYNDLCLKQVFRDSIDCTNTHYSVCICSVTPQISAAFMPAKDKLYDKEGLAGLVLNCSADSWHIMRFLQPLSGYSTTHLLYSPLIFLPSRLQQVWLFPHRFGIWDSDRQMEAWDVSHVTVQRPAALEQASVTSHHTKHTLLSSCTLPNMPPPHQLHLYQPAFFILSKWQQLMPLRKPPRQQRKTT